MIIHKNFAKGVPTAEGEIFRIVGAISGGLFLFIENLSDSATMTYKLQESSDGVTWTDKVFATSSGGTAVIFTVLPEDSHAIKIASSSANLRLLASGNLAAMFSLNWRSATSFDSGSPITITGCP